MASIAPLRWIAQAVFRTRSFGEKRIKRFADGVHGAHILEIGSGRSVNGQEQSAKRHFDATNTFVQSDINPRFGHAVVDATKMRYRSSFDVVICMSVLEHVYDNTAAVRNIHASLKTGGIAVFYVPFSYPLHDEPHDYWRYTEHSLRKLLAGFRIERLEHGGLRRFPIAYYVEARKKASA